MYQFCQESELLKPVSEYLKTLGYSIRYEIRIGFCRADIVAFKEEEVVGIELKLSDWKKAIVQAKNYQLGCDYVYLAFPLTKVFNILQKAEHIIRKEGIGLLAVCEERFDVRHIIDASKSNKKMGSVSLEWIDRYWSRTSTYRFL